MLQIIYQTRFKKDLDIAVKRGKDLEKFKKIVTTLLADKPLPIKNRNHRLKGEFADYWECHIEPDWLLIYKRTPTELILARMGTHADLF